jgi:hypothetical protein
VEVEHRSDIGHPISKRALRTFPNSAKVRQSQITLDVWKCVLDPKKRNITA